MVIKWQEGKHNLFIFTNTFFFISYTSTEGCRYVQMWDMLFLKVYTVTLLLLEKPYVIHSLKKVPHFSTNTIFREPLFQCLFNANLIDQPFWGLLGAKQWADLGVWGLSLLMQWPNDFFRSSEDFMLVLELTILSSLQFQELLQHCGLLLQLVSSDLHQLRWYEWIQLLLPQDYISFPSRAQATTFGALMHF